jgi:hypothetical protein
MKSFLTAARTHSVLLESACSLFMFMGADDGAVSKIAAVLAVKEAL